MGPYGLCSQHRFQQGSSGIDMYLASHGSCIASIPHVFGRSTTQPFRVVFNTNTVIQHDVAYMYSFGLCNDIYIHMEYHIY